MAKHHGGHGHKSHHHGHHGHHASGGRTHMKVAGNPDVFKEAEGKEPYAKGDEKKHGGKVKHHGKHHRKHGGHVGHHAHGGHAHHEEHEMHGHHSHHRADHKPRGRKRGGGVGADRSPLSTAHRGAKGAGHGSSEPHDTYGGTPA